MEELTEADLKEIARLDAEIEQLESEIGLRIALREVTRTGKGYPPADFSCDDADDAEDSRPASPVKVASKAVQLRSLVRRHVIRALEEDLIGGELLMKEVWEECASYDHVEAAKRELEEILSWLRDREQRLGVGA